MRIGFVGSMPPRVYSGGRLVAISFAESLAANGNDVTFYTSTFPRMAREFSSFSKLKYDVGTLEIGRSFQWAGFDWIVIVPQMGKREMHAHWAEEARRCGARVALLNFESPNWFNSLSNASRDPSLWSGWTAVSEKADLIVSLSEEGRKWAEKFYSSVPSDCSFGFVYPSINSKLADRGIEANRGKRRVISYLTRVDKHKGLDLLGNFASKDFSGFSVDVYLGNGTLSRDFREEVKGKFSSAGMKVRFLATIVGRRKFRAISRSTALLFPTHFEGFGLPPLEAAYCGTPAVVSSLPVLQEYGQSDFEYFSNDSAQSAREALARAIESTSKPKDYGRLRSLAEFHRSGSELSRLLQRSGG